VSRLSRSFGVIASTIMRDPSLSPQAKALYALYATYADEKGYCWPSTSTVSEALGISVNTTQRLIKELVQNGVIDRSPQYGATGVQVSSSTRLLDVVIPKAYSRPDEDTPPSVGDTTPPSVGDSPPVDGGQTRPIEQDQEQELLLTAANATPSVGFDDWWRVVPRKVAKGAAARAWRAAMKETTAEQVIEATRKGIGWNLAAGEQYVPHPATWLWAQRWLDEQPAAYAGMDPAFVEALERLSGGSL